MKTTILTPLVSIFLTLSALSSYAQRMTLVECMEYAIENSLSVEQSENSLHNAKLERQAAVAAFFPSASASSSASKLGS